LAGIPPSLERLQRLAKLKGIWPRAIPWNENLCWAIAVVEALACFAPVREAATQGRLNSLLRAMDEASQADLQACLLEDQVKNPNLEAAAEAEQQRKKAKKEFIFISRKLLKLLKESEYERKKYAKQFNRPWLASGPTVGKFGWTWGFLDLPLCFGRHGHRRAARQIRFTVEGDEKCAVTAQHNAVLKPEERHVWHVSGKVATFDDIFNKPFLSQKSCTMCDPIPSRSPLRVQPILKQFDEESDDLETDDDRPFAVDESDDDIEICDGRKHDEKSKNRTRTWRFKAVRKGIIVHLQGGLAEEASELPYAGIIHGVNARAQLCAAIHEQDKHITTTILLSSKSCVDIDSYGERADRPIKYFHKHNMPPQRAAQGYRTLFYQLFPVAADEEEADDEKLLFRPKVALFFFKPLLCTILF
jgi:hypothetical protein